MSQKLKDTHKQNIDKLSNLSQSQRYKVYQDIYLEYTSDFIMANGLLEFSKHIDTDKETTRSLIDAGKMVFDNNLYYI